LICALLALVDQQLRNAFDEGSVCNSNWCGVFAVSETTPECGGTREYTGIEYASFGAYYMYCVRGFNLEYESHQYLPIMEIHDVFYENYRCYWKGCAHYLTGIVSEHRCCEISRPPSCSTGWFEVNRDPLLLIECVLCRADCLAASQGWSRHLAVQHLPCGNLERIHELRRMNCPASKYSTVQGATTGQA